MGKRKNHNDEDEFLTDYREWVEHRHNPFRWLGTISNFSLRAYRNRPKPKRRDGIVLILASIFMLSLTGAIAWSTYETDGDWAILPALILFFILGILILIRGLTLVLGIASDREVEMEEKNHHKNQ
jgi:hypothetical protein